MARFPNCAKYAKRIWVIHPIQTAIAINTKVGCTSIKRAFSAKYGRASLKESLHSWDKVPEGYTQVMQVRSPWERLRSFYAHNMQLDKQKATVLKMGVRYNMTFVELLRLIESTGDEYLDKHFIPQFYLFESKRWNGQPTIERFEEFQTWWKKYPQFPALPHFRKSIARKPKWTAEAVEIIAKRYKTDIELFNYEAPI